MVLCMQSAIDSMYATQWNFYLWTQKLEVYILFTFYMLDIIPFNMFNYLKM